MRLPLLVAGLLLGGAARVAPVKIGFIDSTSGPEAPIGESLANGVKLAEEDLRAKGIDVVVVSEDDAGEPATGISAMEKLATRDGVAGVVGAYTSAVTSAVARVAERYRVPLVNPVASKEEITRQGYRWVFRVSATSRDYASVLLEMAAALGRPGTMAILHEDTDFGVSHARAARLDGERRGIRLVLDEAYSKGSPDFRSTLLRVKVLRPDLVFLASYAADAILLMRQAREIGLAPMAFLGAGAGFSTAAFAAEKDISGGVFFCTQWAPEVGWAGAREFAERYRRRFGSPATYHAATAHAAAMILGQVAAEAQGDRERIRQLLASGSWDTVDGPVRFADYDGYTHQNRHQMLVEQIQDGAPVTVWPPALRQGRPIWPFAGWKR